MKLTLEQYVSPKMRRHINYWHNGSTSKAPRWLVETHHLDHGASLDKAMRKKWKQRPKE